MTTETKPGEANKASAPLTIYDKLTRWGLLLVSALCVLAAVAHAIDPTRFDQTTGIFLGMAAAVLVIREVTRFETPWFKLEKKVHEELEKAKTELANKADENAKQIEDQVKQKTKQIEAEVKQVDQQVGAIIQEGGLNSVPRSQQAKPTSSRKKAIAEDHPDDPHKGKFGRSPVDVEQHRQLRATYETPYGRQNLPYEITFWVESTDEANHPLEGEVTFYLHPSFATSKYTVEVEDGKAEDEITTWGSFTLGAVCVGSGGKECRLELDLAELPGVSQKFKDS